MSLPGEQLREFLATHKFLGGIQVMDRDYSLPDGNYISRFGKRFRNFLFSIGVTYAAERWDCDNFALIAVGLAKLDHGNHFKGETDLAVGMVSIVTETTVHVLVGVVHDEGGKLKLRLYEPQPNGVQCFVELQQQPEQFLSCYF